MSRIHPRRDGAGRHVPPRGFCSTRRGRTRDSHSDVPYDGAVTSTASSPHSPSTSAPPGQNPGEARQPSTWEQPAAAVRSCGAAQGRRGYAARAAVRAAVVAAVGDPRSLRRPRAGRDPLVGLARSAARDAGRGPDAVLASRQPQGRDIRRDVLREGRVGADPPRLRGQLGQERQRPDPEDRRPCAAPARRRVRRASAGRQVRHRHRRVAVRFRSVRLAVHDRGARHAVRVPCVPHRAAAVPLDVPRLPGRSAARRGRPRVRDEPHGAARLGPRVLRRRRVRLPGRGPRQGARQAGRRAPEGRGRRAAPRRAHRRDPAYGLAPVAAARRSVPGARRGHEVERLHLSGRVRCAHGPVGRRRAPRRRGRGRT